MLKDLLARFKKVFTIAEWNKAAQEALSQKEFVVASLDELHRVEKAEAAAGRDRVQQRGYDPRQPQSPFVRQAGNLGNRSYLSVDEREEDARKRADASLADLMNAIRQQQATQ